MSAREFWTTLLLLATIHSARVASQTSWNRDQARDHALEKKATAIDLLGDFEDRIAHLLKENGVDLLEDHGQSLPPRERTLSRRMSRLEEAIAKLFDTRCSSRYQRCLERATDLLWPAEIKAAGDRLKRLLDYLVLILAWDCDDLYRGGIHQTGVHFFPRHEKLMFCDMTEVDGAWTVLLRRGPPTDQSFHKSWYSYEIGFGNPKAEFWLGNRYTKTITSLRQNELLVAMTNYDGENYYALYDQFALNSTYYQLDVSYYQGNATDALATSKGMKFTTYDMDNDKSDINCAIWIGGWWYRNCYTTRLTGLHVLAPNVTNFSLMQWIRDWDDLSRTILPVRAEMKFRPMHFVSRSSRQDLEDYEPRYSGSLFVPVAEPSLL